MSIASFIPTAYEMKISETKAKIETMGNSLPQDEYEMGCYDELAGLYESLEKLGASNRVLLEVATDFVEVIESNAPAEPVLAK